MSNYNDPKPNSDDLVGGILTGIVLFAAVLIAALSDNITHVAYLYAGPVIMLMVWLFTRKKEVSAMLVGGGFAVALIVTLLAI